MRLLRVFAIGSIAAGLAGCTGIAPQSAPAAGSSATAAGGGTAPRVVTSTAPPAAPASPGFQAGARAAAVRFYGLYSAGQFSALWNLLSPTARGQVPKGTWVAVHDACPGAAVGKSRAIKAVTAFGSAAIVTEVIAGNGSSQATTEDVFNYVGGSWSYSPAEVGIYRHGSTAADVAAAKTAGFCAGWKVF